IEAIEPAWIDDADLALEGPVDAADAPGVGEMLERLSLLAARQPGGEAAVGIALLPWAHRPILPRMGAEAARAVAVAAPDRRADARADAPPLGPPATRLRLVGTIDRRSAVQLDVVRTEVRAVGAGADVDTDVVVVGLDARGKAVAQRRVTSATM